MIEWDSKEEMLDKIYTQKRAFTEDYAQDSFQNIRVLIDKIEELERKIQELESIKEKVILIREIDEETAKREILELINKRKIMYPSEIAEELNIDVELVFKIIKKLKAEGKIDYE